MNRKLSVTARRRITAVCVAIDFGTLAWLAVEAQVFHRRVPLTAVAALLVSAVCGLNYLRSTRGES